MELGATHTIQVTTRDSKCLAKQIVETLGCHADKTIECSGAEPSVATGIFVSVYMYGTRQKKVSGLSQYLPVLPQYFCWYFLSTSVGTYCTVRLKHITHAKKFFTRSEQLYIHNSPAVL